MICCAGNILDYIGKADAICVTTNGFVTARGANVMGRGIAKEMSNRYPDLPFILGRKIRQDGHQVHLLKDVQGTAIVAFPTKPASIVLQHEEQIIRSARGKYEIGERVPGFHAKSDLNIIAESCEQVAQLANRHPEWKRILLPIPGCGCGELSVRYVYPVCASRLDDRFIMVSFKSEDFWG